MLTPAKIVLVAALLLGAVGMAQAFTGSGTTQPSDPSMSSSSWASAGVPPGVNPNNPQDLTNRGNPQDLTLPGASNPQDLRR